MTEIRLPESGVKQQVRKDEAVLAYEHDGEIWTWHGDTADLMRVIVEEPRDLLRRAEDALIWCSAAGDLAPGGIAHRGWERVGQPVLAAIRKYLRESEVDRG